MATEEHTPETGTATGTSSAADQMTTIKTIDPLSALKVGAGFGACLFIVWMIAVTIIWAILSMAGVWDRLQSLLSDLLGLDGVGAGVFFGTAAVLGLLEFIIFALLAPLAAVVYNYSEQLFGGLKITLK